MTDQTPATSDTYCRTCGKTRMVSWLHWKCAPESPMTDQTPATEAGRRLLNWADSDMSPLQTFGYDTVSQAVLAIEAGARADALREAADRVRALTHVSGPTWVNVSEVLAILDPEAS